MTNETKWSIDQNSSEIAFKLSHFIIAHIKGAFKTFDASIYTIGKDFGTAEIDVWIDASSITTGDPKRDEFLTGADFLDTQNHKQITFTSSTIGKADAKGNQELWGELTLRGITKKIKLNVLFGGITNDPSGNEKAEFIVTGTISRSDWGLVGNKSNETGGQMVGDEITISSEIELINVGQKELTMELEQTSDKKNAY